MNNIIRKLGNRYNNKLYISNINNGIINNSNTILYNSLISISSTSSSLSFSTKTKNKNIIKHDIIKEGEEEEEEEEEQENDEIIINKKLNSKITVTNKIKYKDSSSIIDKSEENLKKKKKETKVMDQYNAFKLKHPNDILFFEMGDFYEMFHEDAKIASRLLNITLTSRKQGEGRTENIPMCGVPAATAEIHISKLVKFGKSVAICDQIDKEDSIDQQQQQTKKVNKILQREVVRVITPGTIYEDRYLSSSSNNYLCSILPNGFHSNSDSLNKQQKYSASSKFSISWLDMSTGSFYISTCTFENLTSELNRIQPKEILLPLSLIENQQISKLLKPYHISVENDNLNFNFNEKTIKIFRDTYCGVASDNIMEHEEDHQHQHSLKSKSFIKQLHKNFTIDELNCSGSILSYVVKTQMGSSLPSFNIPEKVDSQNSMFIDYSTMQSLEITKTYQGERKGSLLDCLDKTLTAPGSRLLFSRIQSPSLDLNEINNRLNLVEFFYNNIELTKQIRKILTDCLDLERSFQRIKINKAGPKDLSAIGKTLGLVTKTKEYLEEKISTMKSDNQVDAVKQLIGKIGDFEELISQLTNALVVDPPYYANDGNFIRDGYSKQLDDYVEIRDNSKSLIKGIENKYREQLSIPTSLKVKNNSIIGYYFEIPSTLRDKIPSHFIHVQTLLSVMRFKSNDLIQMEEEINIAASKVLKIELKLFELLLSLTRSFGDQIKEASSVMAIIDVSTSLALISKERQYIKPILISPTTSDSYTSILDIKDGRHPTVEQSTNEFIGNDCKLNNSSDNDNEASLWLITGANMGGKSTYLRQNALIIIMAQMGSFVPASYAKIGIADAIFSRVGSSDDLSNDRSTFMVEMVETASILKKATKHSFVIMDEVGRGTSTLDGISIAQSVVEHLYQVNKSRTLFATHYHELTRNLEKTNHIKCYSLAIEEDDNDILFTHKIIPGVSNKSYGIFCAKMAGLPESVLKRSKSILTQLESTNNNNYKL